MQFNSSVSHYMMENDIFSMPIDMAGRNPIVMDGIPSHSTPNSLVQSSTFDLNNQNQIMSGYPVLSALQGEHIGVGFVDSGGLVSRSLPPGRNFIRDGSLINLHSNDNTEFQEQFMGGTPISATTLANLLAARSGLHEDLNDIAVSTPLVFPSEVFRTHVSNDCSNTSNSSFATAANCGYDGVHGDMNNKWDFNKFLPPLELAGKPSERTRFQQMHLMGNLDPNGWIPSNNANVTADHPYGSSKFCNELSLSLSTSQPSILFGTAIPDQCSEINCSGVTRHCLNETGLGLDQTSCNSKELSLSFGSYRPAQFSQVISGSRYLRVIQEILAEIASYSLDNHDQMSYSTGGIGAGVSIPFSSSCPTERGISLMGSDESTDGDGGEDQMEPYLQRRDVEVKKSQLLALLQVVDERYNQCLDEVHTVISAFHAATELDPQIHARFALQTISFLYKNLRERISNQILTMGANFKSVCIGENEGAFETSFIQKQWALQQLKRKDHQLWRPQRGLPERSVSVLRAWMFQNFLHPYPKDAEKHLLAVKSGLTRSQVSNWFINARVRLWKPMIEEMYSEMNSRKARRNDEGNDSNHRKSHISIDNQRFKMN